MNRRMTRGECAEACRDMQDGGVAVTLDGNPAKISGFKNEFATVWDVKDHSRSAQWAWETVYNIMKGDGKFKTS